MKLKIAICDDEIDFLAELERYIFAFADEYDVSLAVLRFSSGTKLLTYFEKYRDISVVFLDIKMEQLDGLGTAKRIRALDIKVKIVFLTAFTKYAVEGYAYNATRYLLKPVDYPVLSKELLEVIHTLEQEESAYFIVKNDAGIFKMYYDKIHYIETYGRNTKIHTNGNSIISYQSMKEYEKLLDERFYRTHISYIVNLAYINRVQKFSLFMSDETEIPISKARKCNFTQRMTDYYGNLL